MLQREIALRQGEAIEQQALPILRKVFRSEFRKANVQLGEDVKISNVLKEIRVCISLIRELHSAFQQRKAE